MLRSLLQTENMLEPLEQMVVTKAQGNPFFLEEIVQTLVEQDVVGQVAVGMPVTRHPPHRSRRAALPHRAPASGLRAGTRRCLPYAAERM